MKKFWAQLLAVLLVVSILPVSALAADIPEPTPVPEQGTLTINGGTFACEPFGDPYGYNFLLNCIDSAYKNGTAKIIVKGGTFVNFNPADCSAEGAHTNFVAPDYKVVSETQANGGVWYTVVKAN